MRKGNPYEKRLVMLVFQNSSHSLRKLTPDFWYFNLISYFKFVRTKLQNCTLSGSRTPRTRLSRHQESRDREGQFILR